jgi:hypothetical protein
VEDFGTAGVEMSKSVVRELISSLDLLDKFKLACI